MARNASDVLFDTISSWGVDTIFGLPGDGINGLMEALRVREDKIRFIQVRHEEAAAFMACAYAKYTGRLGCCIATSGPGGVHLLNGLYDAKMDQAPVLALTGQTFSDIKGTNFQQEVNLPLLFTDVAVYNQEIINPEQVETVANEACRRALNERGVSHICFPVDYQTKPFKGSASMHKQQGATGGAWAPVNPVPERDQLEAAAEILNSGKKIAILVGQGARNAGADVIELADRLGAPVIKALLGKDVVPDDHPLTTGGLGLLGTRPSQDAMEQCDTLIMIGTSFPYMEYLPKVGQARAVQIDDKPDRIGLRYPIEVGLVGDARRTLCELLPFIHQRDDRTFLTQAQEGMKKWNDQMAKRTGREDVPLKPQRVAEVLSELADNDAIISGDSGTNTTWLARYFKIRGSQKFSCSGNLATMAPGLPYAIAAKVAFPDRQSLALVGDGGFTMLMGEFATACKYELPIVVVIIKNNTLGQIKWEQIVFLGNPEYGCDLHPIDFAKFAEACGGSGYRVSQPGELAPTLKTALASRRPAVVEVIVDPLEPPMPSKVEIGQATKFAKALLRGEQDGDKIVKTVMRDKFHELK